MIAMGKSGKNANKKIRKERELERLRKGKGVKSYTLDEMLEKMENDEISEQEFEDIVINALK